MSILPGTTSARKAFPQGPGPFRPTRRGKDPIEIAAYMQPEVANDYTGWRETLRQPGISAADAQDAAGWYTTSGGAQALSESLDAAKAHAAKLAAKAQAGVDNLAVPDDKHGAATRVWNRIAYAIDAAASVPEKVAVVEQVIKDAKAANDHLALAAIKEEVPARFSTIRQPGGKPVPMDWFRDALADALPGNQSAKADATLAAKRVSVLSRNHDGLLRAMKSGGMAPDLLDPYQVVASPDPYSNGEPYSPHGA